MVHQSHRSDPRTLGRRTLQGDHRLLAGMLRPGMSVLDVGCGIGAITAGIARAAGPEGRVVGVDRDEGLLELARQEHGAISNLHFECGDALSLNHSAAFDIVTAARTLQWIARPDLAVVRMKEAAKRGGMLVVLDYNHVDNSWSPEPPCEFVCFYNAFLAWRRTSQWDNEMADHLPALFRSAGLRDIESHVQDEIVERGEAEFAGRSCLWAEVIENVGEQIARAGFCTMPELHAARQCYGSWVPTELVRQTLSMRTVIGRVP